MPFAHCFGKRIAALLLLLLRSARPGSARAGDGVEAQQAALRGLGGAPASEGAYAKWYDHSYEHSYVEVFVLIVLVCLALLFETVWHYAAHHADESYGYGKLTDLESASQHAVPDLAVAHGHTSRYQRVDHVQLFKELTNRAGGEFMTLGFLAFCVFVCNNFQGFEYLAGRFHSGTFHYPKTGTDWLHLVEVVHMQLFMGMVLYFFLISRIVAGAVVTIRQWEQLRLRRVSAAHLQRGAPGGGPSVNNRSLSVSDTELAKYLMWREYFIQRLLRWRERRPLQYRRVLRSLDIDPRWRHSQDLLVRQIDSRFSFSAYLALNVEAGIRDSIVVHRTTWVAVLALLGVFELLCRCLHVDIGMVTPFFILVAVSILFVMAFVVHRREARIGRFAGEQAARALPKSASSVPAPGDGPGGAQGSLAATGRELSHDSMRDETISVANTENLEDAELNFNQKHSTEILMLRVLQTVIFMISYVFARLLMDFSGWKDPAQVPWRLLYCALFALLSALLAHVLPHQVPTFLALMALPPFDDDSNINLFFAVLADERNWQEQPAKARLRSTEGAEGGSARTEADVAQFLPILQEAAAKSGGQGGDLAAVCQFLLHLEQRVASVESTQAHHREPRFVDDIGLSGFSEGLREHEEEGPAAEWPARLLGARPCSQAWKSRPRPPLEGVGSSSAESCELRDDGGASDNANVQKLLTPSAWRLGAGAPEEPCAVETTGGLGGSEMCQAQL